VSKKRRLAAVSILSLVLPLILATWAMAAPNLVGKWQGTAPYIVPTGCSSENVTVTISAQCSNLFAGTVPVDNYLIPVVGRYYPESGAISISGTLENLTTQPFYFYSVSLAGIYVASNTPSISVTSYSLMDYTGTVEILLNREYDTFSLTKQTQ
jgi:hypothetical protein